MAAPKHQLNKGMDNNCRKPEKTQLGKSGKGKVAKVKGHVQMPASSTHPNPKNPSLTQMLPSVTKDGARGWDLDGMQGLGMDVTSGEGPSLMDALDIQLGFSSSPFWESQGLPAREWKEPQRDSEAELSIVHMGLPLSPGRVSSNPPARESRPPHVNTGAREGAEATEVQMGLPLSPGWVSSNPPARESRRSQVDAAVGFFSNEDAAENGGQQEIYGSEENEENEGSVNFPWSQPSEMLLFPTFTSPQRQKPNSWLEVDKNESAMEDLKEKPLDPGTVVVAVQSGSSKPHVDPIDTPGKMPKKMTPGKEHKKYHLEPKKIWQQQPPKGPLKKMS